jgi:cytochrome c oxidase cbb3-type subunit 3
MKVSLWLLIGLALLVLFMTTPVHAAAGSSHEEGRKIYNYRCYYCHGYSGDAKTLAAKWLSPAPANFSAMSPESRTEQQMQTATKHGIADTAMMSFSYFLGDEEIKTVVNFIRNEFMKDKAINTRYHTEAAGWPNHERYSSAFPFARGDIAIDSADDTLTASQRAGKVLYLSACITCHDQGRVESLGPIWRSESISYPRNNYSFTDFDGISGASVFLKHDRPISKTDLSTSARQGQTLWDNNCAFCHAKDGTGHNWIGSFLESKPRDLTSAAFMGQMSRETLKTRIKIGVFNTSMPAWKDVLTEEQLNDIIDYIDQAFFPISQTQDKNHGH